MGEVRGGATSSARASSSSSFSSPGPSPIASSSAHAPNEAAAGPSTSQRQRFSVELRPGETTIVSWKKLVRECNKRNGGPPAPSGVNPALESRIAPSAAVQQMGSETKEAQPPPNRFSAVIEKIERLYMGEESSDEEQLDVGPDDDQYDTEDSFIDDAELNEYFEVEKSATKHNGFFVNRGMLERVSEHSSSPILAPEKRRRKDSTKIPSAKHVRHAVNDLVNMGNVRMKAAARSIPLAGKKSSSTSRILSPCPDHNQDGKIMKNISITSMGICRKKSADPSIKLDSLSSLKKENKDILASHLDEKDVEMRKVGTAQSREPANKLRTDESLATFGLPSLEKSVPFKVESQSRLNNGNEVELSTKVPHLKNGISILPDLNTPGNIYPLQGVRSSRAKEGSGVFRPKGTALERAIRDLEKIVGECRPPDVDTQYCDASSQVIKKRLPQEVKQKLAKVARLAASQGKVKEEDLLDRLMGIVGHLVQRKTLKKNLREMVELGLSAKQIKADKLQQIKKEVVEMIRTWIMHSKTKVAEQQGGSFDGLHTFTGEERITLEATYSMDDAIEDKICDLYDLYVEGMDEDKGPQIRKFYAELAELWPNGCMDNMGIKRAVLRAKERKRALYRQQGLNEERIKRKRLSAAVRMQETVTLGLQLQVLQDIPDSTGQVPMSSDKMTSNQPLPSSGRMMEPVVYTNASSHHLGYLNKIAGDGHVVSYRGMNLDAAASKKKLKRKFESETEDIHVHPAKHNSCPGKEKRTLKNHTANSNISDRHKLSLQLPLPGSELPS